MKTKDRQTQGNDRKSLLMLIISMIVFGTIGIFRKFIPWSSGMIAFSRGLMGALFLCLFVKIRGGKLRHGIGKKALLMLILSGAAMGFNWILLFEAYNYTSVSVATLCYYMQPVIVIALAPVLLKERFSWKKLLCAGIAVLGMVLVSGIFEGAAREESPKGILLGLGAAALYAAVILINKRIGKTDAYEKTVIQLISATAVMIPYLLLTEDFSRISLELRTLLLILVVGIVHTGMAYAVYFGSMDGLRAQTIAIFSYIDPIAALVLSALILHETLTLPGIIGAVLILGAAAVSERI
ncbi:MAG: EamA family transporter [Parasporobacterium sp.]|nr:EamA family transporter [Parasporobacterium sp.]